MLHPGHGPKVCQARLDAGDGDAVAVAERAASHADVLMLSS